MSKKIGIVVDSTADFPDGITDQFGINVIPVHVVVNGVDYLDGVTITKEKVVSELKKGKEILTRPPTPAEYADFYENLLTQYDYLVSFQISSKLSECYISAKSALKLLQDSDAEKIKIIDTKSISIGQALYTLKAIETLRKEKSLINLESKIDELMIAGVNNFTVDSLKWLKKSGRIGTIGAMVGSMLDIKPIMAVKDSKLTLVNRVRGKKTALEEMAGHAGIVRKRYGGEYDVWVGHCDAEEDAGYLRKQLAIELEMDRNAIAVLEAGASVSVKVGPGSCNWGMLRK